MKRYKITKDIIVLPHLIIDRFGVIEKHNIVGSIPAGTEIFLEEVKEEKECSHPSWDCKGTGNFNAAGLKCTCECEDCRGKDQPKEEKLNCSITYTSKFPDFGAGVLREYKDQPLNPKSCYCTKCSRERDTLWSNAQETLDAIIKRDQPLTPKDVGLTKQDAHYEFTKWLTENNDYFYKLSDEVFERLFQQFLNEYKK